LVNVLILYYSRGGHTDTLAKAISKGVEKVENAKAVLKRVDYATGIELIESDAVAFGSPNYFGYMAGIMKDYFDRTVGNRARVEGRPAAAFTSGSGNSTGALDSLEKMIGSFKLYKVADGLVSEGEPSEEDLAKCVQMGKKLAEEAAKKTSDPKE
jgi:multimeric flavodoxin WrbA